MIRGWDMEFPFDVAYWKMTTLEAAIPDWFGQKYLTGCLKYKNAGYEIRASHPSGGHHTHTHRTYRVKCWARAPRLKMEILIFYASLIIIMIIILIIISIIIQTEDWNFFQLCYCSSSARHDYLISMNGRILALYYIIHTHYHQANISNWKMGRRHYMHQFTAGS